MNGQPCVTSDFLLRSKCSMVPPRLAQGPCGVSSLPFSHNCKPSGLVIEVSGGVPGFSAWCVYMCARMRAWGLSRCIFVFWHRTSSLLPGAYPLSQAGCLGTRTHLPPSQFWDYWDYQGSPHTRLSVWVLRDPTPILMLVREALGPVN